MSEPKLPDSKIEFAELDHEGGKKPACRITVGGSRYTFYHKELGTWLIENLFLANKISRENRNNYLEAVNDRLPENTSGDQMEMHAEDADEIKPITGSSLVM